jgi:UDP-N-acetylmuramoyl-tripeptide--D-alanyl-D-alanine ligase
MLLKARIVMPDGAVLKVESHLTGSYNLYNILAAATLGYHFGVDSDSIVRGIREYKPSNMRSQWLKTPANNILLDAYNANPSSMALALKHFQSIDLPGKMLVLGDMFELGQDSIHEHSQIVKLIRELGFQSVYLAGKDFYEVAVDAGFNVYRTTDDLLEELSKMRPTGKTILVKGSRGMKLERVLDYL